MTVEAFERILIVDDDPEAREAYSWAVEDADLEAVQVEGPLGSLHGFVAGASMERAGALCDFELRVKNFASFTGAELVAAWYQAGVPAVLCTRFEKAQLDRIRPYRPWIPCLLTPTELNPESLLQSLETVMREIEGEFRQSRTTHRTLVRVIERDPDDPRNFFFEMPAWSSDTMLRYRVSDVPAEVQSQIREGYRTHVRANIGAENFEDLYFTDWESS